MLGSFARPIFTLALAVAATASVHAQDSPTLTPDDYGKWETLGTPILAPSGEWIAYPIRRVNEENELRIRDLRRDTTRVVAYGTGPRFSANDRWLAWSVDVSSDERKRLEKADEPVRNGVGLLDLQTGEERTFDEIAQFAFSADGAFLVLHGYALSEPENKGADLRVLNLESGAFTPFGNVSESEWSDMGSILAMALSTGADAGNGIQVYAPATGRLQSLVNSGAAYRQLAWREDAFDLAALRSAEDASEDGSTHHLIAWRGLDGTPQSLELAAEMPGIADTLEVVQHRRPVWPRTQQLAIGFTVDIQFTRTTVERLAVRMTRRRLMPYVNVRITKGVTREQKAQLVREIDRTPKVDPRSM